MFFILTSKSFSLKAEVLHYQQVVGMTCLLFHDIVSERQKWHALKCQDPVPELVCVVYMHAEKKIGLYHFSRKRL